MSEENTKKIKTKRTKITTELGLEPKIVAEDIAIKEKKTSYSPENLVQAIADLSLHVDNIYFKAPYVRCPDCNKSNSTVMAHFGVGGASLLGNLKGFQVAIGDVVGWSSHSYKGLSMVKSKYNGVLELETSPFDMARKEPAVIERMLVPSKYRPILAEMAEFLASGIELEQKELTKIGEGAYPNAIAKKL